MKRLIAAVAVVTSLCIGQAALAGERIIALGGAITEIVYAIGAGDLLVGVDQTSVFPAAATKLPQVGYVRALGPEGILALDPTLILAAPEAGPAATMEHLTKIGVKIVRLPEGFDRASVLARIDGVSNALAASSPAAHDKGKTLAQGVAADFDQLAKAIEQSPRHPKVVFLLGTSGGSLLAAGRHTAADAMIAMAGGHNAVAGYDGYKPLSPEAMAEAQPDIIVTTQQVADGAGGAAALLAQPVYKTTPAGRAGRLVAFDTQYLLSFGPRTPAALRDLAAALDPTRPLPALTSPLTR